MRRSKTTALAGLYTNRPQVGGLDILATALLLLLLVASLV
jgi:hypothetical protein